MCGAASYKLRWQQSLGDMEKDESDVASQQCSLVEGGSKVKANSWQNMKCNNGKKKALVFPWIWWLVCFCRGSVTLFFSFFIYKYIFFYIITKDCPILPVLPCQTHFPCRYGHKRAAENNCCKYSKLCQQLTEGETKLLVWAILDSCVANCQASRLNSPTGGCGGMRGIIISSEVLLLLPFLPLWVLRPTIPPSCSSGAAEPGGFGQFGSCRGDFTNRANRTKFWPQCEKKNSALSWSHLAKRGPDKMRLACLNVIVSRFITSPSKLQVLSMRWFIRWMGDIDPSGPGDILSARAGIAMSSSFSVHFPNPTRDLLGSKFYKMRNQCKCGKEYFNICEKA